MEYPTAPEPTWQLEVLPKDNFVHRRASNAGNLTGHHAVVNKQAVQPTALSQDQRTLKVQRQSYFY